MIGIFDSGSGGLTVLKAIRDVLPSCDVLYFGDIKNAPYGSKSQEELSLLTIRAIKRLQEGGAKRIVSACNSTSASLAVSLFDAFDIAPTELIEMVGSTVAYLKSSPQRVMLCATPATVNSGIYQNAFRMVGKQIEVLGIPELAGAIEFAAPKEKIKEIIVQAFKNTEPGSFDVLVLACTHYPLVAEIFGEVLGGSVAIFDPAIAVAERAHQHFWPQEVGDGKTTFLISQDSSHFRGLVSGLFPDARYIVEVIQ